MNILKLEIAYIKENITLLGIMELSIVMLTMSQNLENLINNGRLAKKTKRQDI